MIERFELNELTDFLDNLAHQQYSEDCIRHGNKLTDISVALRQMWEDLRETDQKLKTVQSLLAKQIY